MTADNNTAHWTYGAEHEWADHPLDRDVPKGFGRDTHDITIVNSSGIANDPRGKTYAFGGEFNTPPTETIADQVGCMTQLKEHYPEATINYRSNLHIHIRVPGLGQDLAALKEVQEYVHRVMRRVLTQIEPLPHPRRPDFVEFDQYRGAARRWRRRRVSHQTLLTDHRLTRQLGAGSLEDFYAFEVPHMKSGDFRPLWHLQPRLCVNLRQHRETDTVEFRHFPGTMDEEKLTTCISWCRDFLFHALRDLPIDGLLARPEYQTDAFPPFPEYVHWMERRYRATVHDGTLSKDEIQDNINRILRGDFH